MNLVKAIFLSTMLLFATFAGAATSKFEAFMPSSSTYFMFPGLDLNNIENITLTVSSDNTSPDYTIDRMELKFPNANNLVVNNFKRGQNSGSFYAIANDKWVFRKLIVELNMPPQNPTSGEPVDINVFVANSDYFNNNYFMPPQGELLVTASGMLVDKTPNPIADKKWVTVDYKGLNMKLYQRPENSILPPDVGSGFKVVMNWMGQGERTVYLPTPFSQQDYDKFKAVSLNFTDIPGLINVTMLEIGYEDETGYKQVAPVGELKVILDQAYQQ
ncbi:MAG: hypothetical protein P8166_10210 [Candidatus Thiodiazotropha sp.]